MHRKVRKSVSIIHKIELSSVFYETCWRQHPDWSHQEKGQVGRRQNLQSQKRKDLQVFHMARRQQPESPRLPRHVLRDPDLDKKVTTFWKFRKKVVYLQQNRN